MEENLKSCCSEPQWAGELFFSPVNNCLILTSKDEKAEKHPFIHYSFLWWFLYLWWICKDTLQSRLLKLGQLVLHPWCLQEIKACLATFSKPHTMSLTSDGNMFPQNRFFGCSYICLAQVCEWNHLKHNLIYLTPR